MTIDIRRDTKGEGKQLMRARLDGSRLTLEAQTPDEKTEICAWGQHLAGMVLVVAPSEHASFSLEVLGARADVCREPINVWSGAPDPAIRSIGNLATAPFMLDGEGYATVESFWQGLKFPQAERARIAALDGHAAHEAARSRPYDATVSYRGESIPVGTWRHWRLMQRACWAKFTQSEPLRLALLATLPRPIEHCTRPDSKAIPGVVMADIWMRIRATLAAAGEGPFPAQLPEE